MSSHAPYSDPSDDDVLAPEATSRRRSSRACDQCRRTKSKCQRYGSDEDPCHGCLETGSSCTYVGPSHKRGPPKGYIHAIERRLHQVEALMGTIIGSSDPRAQGLFQDLSRDPLACQIIHRVEHGPFGPKGRVSHPFGSTKEDFLAAIMSSSANSPPGSPISVNKSRLKPSELVAMTPSIAWQAKLQELLVSSAPRIPAELTLRRGEMRGVESSPSSASSVSFSCSPSEDSLNVLPESDTHLRLPQRRSREMAPSRASSSVGGRPSRSSLRSSTPAVPDTAHASVNFGPETLESNGNINHHPILVEMIDATPTNMIQDISTGPFSPAATVRAKRSAHDIAGEIEHGRRTRPIPDRLANPSPHTAQFRPLAQECHLETLDLGYHGHSLGVAPQDTFTDMQWEVERMAELDHPFGDTLPAFSWN